jgi:hypothetical protein
MTTPKHHADAIDDAANMAGERALATAHFLTRARDAALADGDRTAADALHAGAMALAALGRRRMMRGAIDTETADLERRAILASYQVMPIA